MNEKPSRRCGQSNLFSFYFFDQHMLFSSYLQLFLPVLHRFLFVLVPSSQKLQVKIISINWRFCCFSETRQYDWSVLFSFYFFDQHMLFPSYLQLFLRVLHRFVFVLVSSSQRLQVTIISFYWRSSKVCQYDLSFFLIN